jgi:hypothetical protein
MRRPSTTTAAALLAAALVAGCTDDGEPQLQCPASTATDACRDLGGPLPSPTVTAVPGQVLAVVTDAGSLELYGIGPRPVARRIRTLEGPKGGRAFGVTLSGGASPRVCAIWEAQGRSTLRCYEHGSSVGQDVAPGSAPLRGAVGLSLSGRGLAWAAQEEGVEGPSLFVQREPGGAVLRLPAYSKPDEDEVALGVFDLTWDGEDTLLVSHAWDDDVNGSIAVVSLAERTAWSERKNVDAGRDWQVVLGAVSPAHDGRVLAVLRGFTDTGEKVEAAELDLRANRIASVVSVPATGRWMEDVSGGPRGVVYRTSGDSSTRTYWRAPGQAHGSVVTGLPSDARLVVAQP